MPQRSLAERTRRAKKEGRKVAVTGDDLFAAAGTSKSKHSMKKSSHVAAFAEPEDRSVSKREPPGRGKALDRKVAKLTKEKPRWTERRAPRAEAARTATASKTASRKTPPKRQAGEEGFTPKVTKKGELTKRTRAYLSGSRTKR